jgi:hypothetical protein
VQSFQGLAPEASIFHPRNIIKPNIYQHLEAKWAGLEKAGQSHPASCESISTNKNFQMGFLFSRKETQKEN